MTLTNLIGIKCSNSVYYDLVLTGITGSTTFTVGSVYSIVGQVEDGRRIEECFEIHDTYTGSTYGGILPPGVERFYLEDPMVFTEFTGSGKCDDCQSFIGTSTLPTDTTPTPTITTTPTVTPTNTITPSITPTNTITPSITPSNSGTPNVTPTITPTPSETPPAVCDFNVVFTATSKCSDTGIAKVTDIVGVGPFEFTWSNGYVGTTATGLTNSLYTVTMRDLGGYCSNITKQVQITTLSDITVTDYTTSISNCFECNGQVTIEIDGGLAPYYYSGDTGQSSGGYVYDKTFTLNNLCYGNHVIKITDSGGCVLNYMVYIPTTSTVKVKSITKKESICNDKGSITVNTENYNGLITYKLSADTELVNSVQSMDNTYTFNDLTSGNYYVGISVKETECDFISDVVTIENQVKFTISASTVGAVCSDDDGSITFTVYSGASSISYPIDVTVSNTLTNQVVYQLIDSNTNTYTINGLNSGNYNISITDNNSCSNELIVTLTGTTGISASAFGYGCDSVKNGTVEVIVHSANEPYTITWYNGLDEVIATNVTEITGLTTGNYYVYIVDNIGCSLIRYASVTCNQLKAANPYIINEVCSQEFNVETNALYTFQMMLYDAIQDYSGGYVIDGTFLATFTGNLHISGPNLIPDIDLSELFYTTTSINDVPTKELWISVVESFLSQLLGIVEYSVDEDGYIIIADCQYNAYEGATIELSIDIDITPNNIDANGDYGEYVMDLNFGTYTGDITLVIDAFQAPDRFIVEYNNNVIADSLFVGDGLEDAYTINRAIIIATTDYPLFEYNISNQSFEPTGEISTYNFTEPEIAQPTIERSVGTTGQIGVDPTYPLGTSPSSEGQLKLTFNKPTQYPSNIKIRAIGVGDTIWNLSFE